jgi:penicillin-binding protein 1C
MGRLVRTRPGRLLAVLAAVAAAAVTGLTWLDRAFPPPLDGTGNTSVEVLDRKGVLLKLFTNSDGRWRLAADLDQIDQYFVEMLVAYEDKRFYRHHGVDPLALVRAATQWLVNGRIVSGGSTITMQLARLLEPRPARTLGAKLLQMARALQLERRLDKREILERYLTLAPYGGNIEGLRAASLAWFGKQPKKLALPEAALLVALPQSPERRRPDRFPDAARSARDRVLRQLADVGLVDQSEVRRVADIPAPTGRHGMPDFAPHLAREALDRNPLANRHHTRLDGRLQSSLETIAKGAARRFGSFVSVALVAADARTGDILASVGSPDIHDQRRAGWIDMSRAVRSPGSTLKPFVYGLAIEDGLVLPETMISDRPANFDGYRPANFDMTYQGDVSIRKALQLSLNIPAVQLMDAVSPVRLLSRLGRAGVSVALPSGEEPGLGIVLGGGGLTLTDLVQLYANLAAARAGPVALGDGVRDHPVALPGPKLLESLAAWHVADILAGVPPPSGSRRLPVAYKTGTSYGYRDAWAIGFDGRRAIGVWVGRPDNGAVPGISGMNSAAPILFEAFGSRGIALEPLPPPPPAALRQLSEELPPPFRAFEPMAGRRLAGTVGSTRLNVAFPSHGSEIELGTTGDGLNLPVVIKLQGGVPPFWLLADGKPIGDPSRRRQLLWKPEGGGVALLTVLDSVGQTRALQVRIKNKIGNIK